MNTTELLNNINNGTGYSTDIILSHSELEIFREMIKIQWLYRIQLLAPRHVRQFDEYGIERYHELAHLINHSKAWPTYARVLPKEATTVVKKMDFYKKLENLFGPIEFGDEQDLGWETIYWRLVRPGKEDTGSLHTDKWFWDLLVYGNNILPSYPFQRLKMWIAIHTEPGKNGLLVVPESQLKKDWKWHAEERHGQKKPVIDEPAENLNLVLLNTEPGRSVIFHDDLLHGGSENLAASTRVSIEFTLFIPKNDKYHTVESRNLESIAG